MSAEQPVLPIPHLGARVGVILFLLALAVRLAATAFVGFSTARFGDSPAYIYAAKELLRTGHYPLATEPFYFRAPGYPVFLIGATLGNPDRLALAKLANAVLGSLAALVLAALSARIFRQRGIAIATGIAVAIHPGLVYLSLDIQSEPLFLLLLLCAGFLLLGATDRPSSGLAVLAGVSTALAALTRPSALALAPLLAAPLFDRRYPIRARCHVAGAAFAGFLFALAPWALRNALVFHELVPVSDAGGSVFYQGNSDWTVRFYQLRTRQEYELWSREMFRDLARQQREIEESVNGSPAKRSRAFLQRALAERRKDLAGWALLLLRKSWDWLRPYPSPLFWPPGVVLGVGAYYLLLYLCAAIGLGRAPRPGVRLFALCLLGLTMAVHVLILVVWRFRVPYWDPILLLYGVCGLFAASDKLLLRWKRVS